MPDQRALNVLITSYFVPEFVTRIRQVDERLSVMDEPELLRPPCFAADLVDEQISRTPTEEAGWQHLLQQADILFDFDQTHLADLLERAPQVRWVQATSAGIDRFNTPHRYADRMAQAVFTTDSGVHAVLLAALCIVETLY